MALGVAAFVLLPSLLLTDAAELPSPCDDPRPGPILEAGQDPEPLAAWLQPALHRIHARWNIPRAVREGEVGTVVLRFVVGKRGKVTGLETVCATGDRSFEKASRLAVKAASPFDPLPEQFTSESLTLRWRFHYERRPDAVDEGEFEAQRWAR